MFKTNFFYLIIVLFALTSCQSPASHTNLKLSFEHLKKISFMASEVEIIYNQEKNNRDASVLIFEQGLTNLISKYFIHKIQENPYNYRLRIEIIDVSIKKNFLKKNKSDFIDKNILKKEPDFYYLTNLDIEIKLRNERGFVIKNIRVNVFNKKTSYNNLSINEKAMEYFVINEAILKILDKEIDKQFKKHLNEFML